VKYHLKSIFKNSGNYLKYLKIKEKNGFIFLRPFKVCHVGSVGNGDSILKSALIKSVRREN